MYRSSADAISVAIVEDDAELVALYESYLQDTFDVQTATSGTEALDLIDDSIDVVLLDRHIPDMSGDEVLTELRRCGCETPVAMVTAVDPDVDIVDLPFDEYLTKPIGRESLVRTVRVLANRTSFERKSRKFFRLASKKASLDTETAVERDDSEEYDALIDRMTELSTELDDTMRGLLENDVGVASRPDFDRTNVETLLTEVGEHTLPEDVRALVDEYQQFKSARPPFMWKWVHRLAPHNTLPCVDRAFTDRVPIDKTITILFITMLDDVLEKHQDRATFDELAKIPYEEQYPDVTRDAVDTEYVEFAEHVWETLLDRIERAPKYEAYEDLFRYDVKQAVTSIEYSDIAIRRPDLVTMTDLERYESHNMVMFAYADIDLMHSSIDARDELSTLREAIWTAQLMARIGNWVSTWERELREGDFSSGPVVYALDNDIIARSELVRANDGDSELRDELVKRIKDHGVEKELLLQWEQHYYRLRGYNDDLSEMDLGPFIEGTEEVLRYHLASTGLK